jgi:hypothetical protein
VPLEVFEAFVPARDFAVDGLEPLSGAVRASIAQLLADPNECAGGGFAFGQSRDVGERAVTRSAGWHEATLLDR